MKIFSASDYPQGGAAWHLLRAGVPTASCFKRILTPKTAEFAAGHKSYINELIAERYSTADELMGGYVSDAMRDGIESESAARAWYAMETGTDPFQVGFCMTDCGRFGCSPDALIGDDGVLEIKKLTKPVHVAHMLSVDLPSDFVAQCHGHLIVTGRKWCDLLLYADMPIWNLSFRVTSNEYTAKLRSALEEFHERYMAALEFVAQFGGPRNER